MSYSWLIPLAVSVVSFTIVALLPEHGDYFRGLEKMVLFYPAAAVVSLIAWLLWVLI
ncbi:MAG: hypothetical protein M0Q95_10870 [Porticoccaceae bacterium]|nr:hypothetical protein [Porticoccaceae bacterium]